jgi:hypothetical protein
LQLNNFGWAKKGALSENKKGKKYMDKQITPQVMPEVSTPVADTTKAVPMAVFLGERLWSVKDLAIYLQKSQRWVFKALRLPDTEAGSIPHVRLCRSPRFVPDDIKAWAFANFPPAATFRTWQEFDRRKRRAS